jgi:nickel/cobalt transporter (NiCoT) family protein
MFQVSNIFFMDPKLALTLTIFLLGVRHGFEPDHLAIIDGMTRCVRANLRLSKYVGFLFSFGHGLIIVFISLFIGIEAEKWKVPIWFEGLGTWITILSLFFLGIFNFYSALNAKRGGIIKFSGARSFLLNKFIKMDHFTPSIFEPIFLGMLFSLSFDTLSQTVAFSLSAYSLAGWLFSIMLGTIFMFGMMLTDGLNGYLVAYIINRADRKSQLISRIFGLLIGGFSIAIAGYYLLAYFYLHV